MVGRVQALQAAGVPLEEVAVLVRTNARAADFEEALAAADIPFQGASLLAREAARSLLRALRASSPRSVAPAVRTIAESQGLLEHLPDGLGDREVTRQADLRRLVRLAEEFDDGTKEVPDFVAELERRFDPRAAGSGVNLLTLHRAKGLEFEAVFLPRVEERELPIRQARTPDAVAEERRLLYVGLTRTRRDLHVSWAGKPSRFLTELGVGPARGVARETLPDDPRFRALRDWRLERSKADDVPAYVVFHNATLAEIAERGPSSLAELASVPGVGPSKLERYGEEVLSVLAGRDIDAA
jgi:DNA helicase-2/ATP-dependent DNA helicase PcrA